MGSPPSATATSLILFFSIVTFHIYCARNSNTKNDEDDVIENDGNNKQNANEIDSASEGFLLRKLQYRLSFDMNEGGGKTGKGHDHFDGDHSFTGGGGESTKSLVSADDGPASPNTQKDSAEESKDERPVENSHHEEKSLPLLGRSFIFKPSRAATGSVSSEGSVCNCYWSHFEGCDSNGDGFPPLCCALSLMKNDISRQKKRWGSQGPKPQAAIDYHAHNINDTKISVKSSPPEEKIDTTLVQTSNLNDILQGSGHREISVSAGAPNSTKQLLPNTSFHLTTEVNDIRDLDSKDAGLEAPQWFNIPPLTGLSSRAKTMPAEPLSPHRKFPRRASTTDLRPRQHDAQGWEAAIRADYNARIMPEKVVLVRHGQSEGNVEESLYERVPDNEMRLTRLGWEQARRAGLQLRNNVVGKDGSVHFIISPYVRTVETFHGIASAWCDPDKEFGHIRDKDRRTKRWYAKLMKMGLTWHEDPRIREQDFGNYQNRDTIKKCKQERHKFGVFYYRFPDGESASDVFDRVSTFLDSLWRSFDQQRAQHYVLVTHGISIRVLLTRYFRYSIDQFNILANPQNCEMIVLGHDGVGRLRLDHRYELFVDKQPQDDDGKDESGKHIHGRLEYREHKRLQTVPKNKRRKRTIRLSYKDDDNINGPHIRVK